MEEEGFEFGEEGGKMGGGGEGVLVGEGFGTALVGALGGFFLFPDSEGGSDGDSILVDVSDFED